MRRLSGLLAVGALVLGSSAASAAPVATTASLGVAIQNVGTVFISGTGTVDQDAATGAVAVGPGLVTLAGTTVIPVTGATAISFLSAMTISNGSGTFSVGGVTGQLPAEVCPTGGLASGSACNDGGGMGGAMNLNGTVFVHVIPHVVVIPVNLNDALIGQGGSTDMPFVIDAAGWTSGFARVGFQTEMGAFTTSNASGDGGPPLQLVTPTFVSALGNLLPIFTSFRLTNVQFPVDGGMVPEPGTLLLLGSGVTGLAVLGRRRR